KLYELANAFIKTINDEDFEMDRKDKTIALTQSGLSKAESFFGYSRIVDKFGPVIEEKVKGFGCEVIGQTICPDDKEIIKSAIKE
ncbi:molybdopterin-binding protein, partial [Clostridioides difficile]